uniref:Uncharacterized protein LOC114342283 n=1 Tax=Diabrotica virgifera virgifera TaxID=50390 RepID=A0A6P7GGJ7_DIAVI
MRGADCASDHELVRAKIKISLKANYKSNKKHRKFNTNKLRDSSITNKYQQTLERHVGNLEQVGKSSIEGIWEIYKNAYMKAGKEILGCKEKADRPWITLDTKTKIKERRAIKTELIKTRNPIKRKEI